MPIIKKIKDINVVLVIDSLDGGGAEHQALMLASGLCDEGFKVTIFPLRGDGQLTEKAKKLNLTIVEGGLKSKRDIKSFILGFILLCKTIRSLNPTIVHTYLPFSNFLGSFAGRLSGASFIITSRRGLIKQNYLKKRWRYIDRLSNFFSNKISVNTLSIKKEMEQVDSANPNKIICIRNGIDLNKFKIDKMVRSQVRSSLCLTEDQFAWVKVANLSNIKGHEDLIKGFKNIDDKYQSKLFFVGKDRGTLSRLRKLVSSLNLENKIKFLGFQEDIPKILSAMDGFICVSHSEGLSNAILEAMAMKLPIIATNVGGNPEILEEQKYGILIEPKSQKDIYNSMTRLMDDKGLRAKLSNACIEGVTNKYSKESMVNSYIDLYESGLK